MKSLCSSAPLRRLVGLLACSALRASLAKSISGRILVLMLAVCAAYAAIPVLGIGQVRAQDVHPTNECWQYRCTQAQAFAECKRYGQAYVDYRNAGFQRNGYGGWYIVREGANTCQLYSYWEYKVLWEESYNGGATWSYVYYDRTRFLSPPPAVDPVKNAKCDPCLAAGNPANMLTGSKQEAEVDFRAPSGPLEWVRTYSSVPLTSLDPAVLGNRWHHSYSHRLLVADTATTGTILMSRPGGGDQYLFIRNQSGVWVPDADVPFSLTPVLDAGVRVGWRVSTPDSTEERYDNAGHLLAITYPNGESVSLTYAGNKLAKVEDRSGHSIELTYVGDLLDTVRLPHGKSIKYSFDAQRRLTSVGYQSNANGTPQFDTVQYQYDNASFPEALTSRTDEQGGRYATWEYDAQERVTRSVHGNPAGAVDQVRIAYSTGGSTVTNSLGESAAHTSVAQLGRAKLAGSNKFCAGCRTHFKTRTYDANGYPDQTTDFAGVVTDRDYNARGLLTRIVEAANKTDGTKRTVQTDWHVSFAVPIERRTYDAAGALVKREVWTYNSRGQVLTHSVHEL